MAKASKKGYNAAISYSGTLVKNGKVDNRVVKDALAKSAVYGQSLVKAISPVRSGAFKAGWSVRVNGGGLLWRNPVPYAGYVDLGTKRMRGRHVLEQATKQTQAYFLKQLGSSLGKRIASNVIQGKITYESIRTFG